MASPARILTVLRSGGEYRPEHVERLRDQCARHAPRVTFSCLSDVDVPGHVPMGHDWPGWWSKIEAFRLTGPILYMDLDTTVVGDLGPLLEIAERERFTALRDFLPHTGRELASGVMAWRGDMTDLYRRFRGDPAQHMSLNRTRRWWGDGGFIERHCGGATYWQDIAPGAVVSHKVHCKAGVPVGARLVAFHGRPRPWEVEAA